MQRALSLCSQSRITKINISFRITHLLSMISLKSQLLFHLYKQIFLKFVREGTKHMLPRVSSEKIQFSKGPGEPSGSLSEWQVVLRLQRISVSTWSCF